MLTISSPINTERLLLRPFTADDLDDLFAIYSRPDVVRYLYTGVQSRDEAQEALQRKVQQTQLTQEGDGLTLAIVFSDAENESTRVIGEVVLWWRSAEHRQGEIGFVLDPAFQGQGFAAEAARAVLALAFRDLKLHRVYGRADARNSASANLMRRLGMRQEAHFMQNEFFKGEWGDEVVFALLKDEWKQ